MTWKGGKGRREKKEGKGGAIDMEGREEGEEGRREGKNDGAMGDQ